MGATFSELVQKTTGPQPWRRVFHAVSGSALVLVFLANLFRDRTLVASLGALLVILLLLDLFRLAIPELNRLFFRSFILLASPREATRPASSTWYVLGILLTLILFPRDAALAGILVLALADPAASAVGQRWGRRKLGAGTVEGSLTFTVVAFGALTPWASWPQALGAALLTTVVEALPWPLDDNLSVPLVAAGALLLLP
ncbi:MAG: diacylglycerol/polyprenol kinase family protein [Longimicrobiales bacterium]